MLMSSQDGKGDPRLDVNEANVLNYCWRDKSAPSERILQFYGIFLLFFFDNTTSDFEA